MQWEGDCAFIDETLAAFIDWISNREHSGQFTDIDKESKWAYCDYTYIKHLLDKVNKDGMQIKDVIDWSYFGFNDDEGEDCALWIGSSGAHTVCHQDAYGYNVVMQVCKLK